jgi:hypothetical protein
MLLGTVGACTPAPLETPPPPSRTTARRPDRKLSSDADPADAALASPDSALAASLPTAPLVTSPWPPLPDGARRFIFREVLVGQLPYPSRRVTWQLALAGKRVVLRREAETSVRQFPRIDATTHAASGWHGAIRTTWEGERDPGIVHLGKLALTRTFGPTPADADVPTSELPSKLDLVCKNETLRVRSPMATLTPGIKRNDDTMTRPTWSPGSTEALPNAWVCTVVQDVPEDVLLWFTKAMAFAPMRKSAASLGGVEWAFANDDMVLQDGGYRFVPESSLQDWARSDTDAGAD